MIMTPGGVFTLSKNFGNFSQILQQSGSLIFPFPVSRSYRIEASQTVSSHCSWFIISDPGNTAFVYSLCSIFPAILHQTGS